MSMALLDAVAVRDRVKDDCQSAARISEFQGRSCSPTLTVTVVCAVTSCSTLNGDNMS